MVLIIPYVLHYLPINVINKEFNSYTINKKFIAWELGKTCMWRIIRLPSSTQIYCYLLVIIF